MGSQGSRMSGENTSVRFDPALPFNYPFHRSLSPLFLAPKQIYGCVHKLWIYYFRGCCVISFLSLKNLTKKKIVKYIFCLINKIISLIFINFCNKNNYT